MGRPVPGRRFGSVAAVAEFLSAAWIDGLAQAAGAAVIDPSVRLTIQQVVSAGPEGAEVAYVVAAVDGHLSVRSGRVDAPDVTFTQDRATALAIALGTLSAQGAFLQGRLRLGGDLRTVLEGARTLADIHDVFAAARA